MKKYILLTAMLFSQTPESVVPAPPATTNGVVEQKLDMMVETTSECIANHKMMALISNTAGVRLALMANGMKAMNVDDDTVGMVGDMANAFGEEVRVHDLAVVAINKAFDEYVKSLAPGIVPIQQARQQAKDNSVDLKNAQLLTAYVEAMKTTKSAVQYMLARGQENKKCTEFFSALTGDDSASDDTAPSGMPPATQDD